MNEQGRVIMLIEENGNSAREIPFEELKEGDVFTIYDNGVQYIDSAGRIQWTVEDAPKPGKDGILFVKVVEDVN